MTQKANSNMHNLGYTCPSSVNKCKQVIDRYGSDPVLASHLISPKCALLSDHKNLTTSQEFYHEKEILLDEASGEARSVGGLCSTVYDLGGILGGYLFGQRVSRTPDFQN